MSYNVRSHLAECLETVAASGRSLRQEIILVDNASRDESVSMVRERFLGVQVIANQENLGFARGANQALARSRGRYLLLLNPDSTVLGDCLPRMVAFMDAHPACGAATCTAWLDRDARWAIANYEAPDLWWEVLFHSQRVGRLLTPPGVLRRYWSRRHRVALSTTSTAVSSIQGNFLLLRRDAYADIGGFDERFFMYYEDADWSRRAGRTGWELCYVPGVGVVHHSNQSAKQLAAAVKGGYLHASRRYFLEKHFGPLRSAAVRLLLEMDEWLTAGVGCADPVVPEEARGVFRAAQCPVELTWRPGFARSDYLVELSVNPLFLGVAMRVTPESSVALPREALAGLGIDRVYWRAIPLPLLPGS